MNKFFHQYFGGWRWVATGSLAFIAVGIVGTLAVIIRSLLP